MKIDLSDVQVGDKVYSIRSGNTVVIQIYNDDSSYRIETELGWSHTLKGRLLTPDKHPSLFHNFEEMQSYFADLEPPRPELKVDDKVMVRDRDSEPWKRRYFAKWGINCIYTWSNGYTSWTTNDASSDLVPWNQWRIPTPEELGEKG